MATGKCDPQIEDLLRKMQEAGVVDKAVDTHDLVAEKLREAFLADKTPQ